MAEVRLEQVRKVYDNGYVAVSDASFTAADGELLVLVGPSGCGKSTVLRMIAGLESISSGTLSIDGRVVNDVAPKDRDIAMVFQSYALYPHMTVAQNLGFGLKLRGHPPAEVTQRIEAAAAKLGLAEILDRRPATLSGGQRQRVALGRALVRNPKVFLLDEPLSNLDAKLRLSMRTEIAKLQRSLGVTMVYVTHDQIEAMTLGQRIVVLDAGVIQQIDTPMRLYEQPVNLFVAGFFGSPAMNFFRGTLSADGSQLAQEGETMVLGDLAAAQPALAGYAGRELVLGLRPEDLSPAAEDSSGVIKPGFAAHLDYVEPVGNEMFLNLRLAGRDLVARLPPRPLPDPGSELRMTFSPARLHGFDPHSGMRIVPNAP